MQAAHFGMTWVREFAEQTFGQSRQAVDAFLRVIRKMAEDFENQAIIVRACAITRFIWSSGSARTQTVKS